MNKLLVNFLFIFIFCQISSIESTSEYQKSALSFVQCAPQLQSHLNKIQKIPEARALIVSIQKEGPIQIVSSNTSLANQFGAFWDPEQRMICIGFSCHTTEGAVIGSILFELHNAFVNSQFQHLDQLAVRGEINQAAYVKSMEYLEYINSLNAVKIAEKGIQMGILPVESRLPTYPSFEEHFSEQQKSGHSACFAHIYDNLCSKNNYPRFNQ